MAVSFEVENGWNVQIVNDNPNIETKITEVHHEKGVTILDFKIIGQLFVPCETISLKWKVPGINVKGIWKPTADFNKRIQADWELLQMESRISINAPVICLFGSQDENIFTFSCSNAIDRLEMNASLREEDNLIYCNITFFSEQHYPLDGFNAQLRLDSRSVHFSESIRDVSRWWESFKNLQPAYVPEIAKKPVYSTWYQFHQNLEPELLLKECKLAKEMGYEVIILDDGWQTKDSNRGYDFTGDWRPERIPEMGEFVKTIHDLGMKVALWYSVPFCGKKSKAYEKFKGKFLTEEHRWAPVFDPRYPEVREHLINIYTSAVRDWNLDGFKLDFIDDFHWYENTSGRIEGMDYDSINTAVDRLLADTKNALKEINPEVIIEFRQKYTGPAMRKYGNMFRAFDCPGDATMNRVRITDIRMLAGNTAVHSDMITWHPNEPLEIAALQMVNTLFGVPQLSILLNKARPSYIKMINFWTTYWKTYADVLVNGYFMPSRPLANYPLLEVSDSVYHIIGVYEDYVVPIKNDRSKIHIINGKTTQSVVLKILQDMGTYQCEIFDCQGKPRSNEKIEYRKGLLEISIPPCGIMIAKK
ncbi:glycoside hydrolase family 36 protein [Maribacter aestuarii]|uniref:glycoside hydrolase family 36 protein n=1 Tax=Maribacter aestuarii TaxID=1130723 RepID=UPI00248A914F|nr:glycoside hydrolase family 36 protein [Maribacter aestuarii]